jgi:hypothetical protein
VAAGDAVDRAGVAGAAATAGVPGLPHPARRFWNQISLCSLIVAGGVGVHAHRALTDPRLPAGPEAIPGASLALFSVTMVILLWALLRIPMGVRAAGEWLRLGLDAVAEGIETGALAERLWELGYRLGQGFNFARPLPAGELGRLLGAPAAPASATAMTAGGA